MMPGDVAGRAFRGRALGPVADAARAPNRSSPAACSRASAAASCTTPCHERNAPANTHMTRAGSRGERRPARRVRAEHRRRRRPTRSPARARGSTQAGRMSRVGVTNNVASAAQPHRASGASARRAAPGRARRFARSRIVDHRRVHLEHRGHAERGRAAQNAFAAEVVVPLDDDVGADASRASAVTAPRAHPPQLGAAERRRASRASAPSRRPARRRPASPRAPRGPAARVHRDRLHVHRPAERAGERADRARRRARASRSAPGTFAQQREERPGSHAAEQPAHRAS